MVKADSARPLLEVIEERRWRKKIRDSSRQPRENDRGFRGARGCRAAEASVAEEASVDAGASDYTAAAKCARIAAL
jgi:hypothetical protein